MQATINEEACRVLESVAKACEYCREMNVAPFLFRATILSDKLLVVYIVAIDIIWLEIIPILHVDNIYTGSENATIIHEKATDDFWLSFFKY